MFRQKDPKPWAPGRGPPGAFAPVPTVRAAELASLRQSSPPHRIRDRGAVSPAGALRWRHGMAGGVTTKHMNIPHPALSQRERVGSAQAPGRRAGRMRCGPYLDSGMGWRGCVFYSGRQGNGPIQSSRRIRQAFMGSHSLYIHQSLYLGSWTTLGIVIGLVPFLNSA